MNVYAIRDRIAGALLGMQMYLLLCFRTDQQAARYFSDAINDNSSVLNKHPADYELIRCGSVTDDGNMIPIPPTLILTGDTLVAIQEDTSAKA